MDVIINYSDWNHANENCLYQEMPTSTQVLSEDEGSKLSYIREEELSASKIVWISGSQQQDSRLGKRHFYFLDKGQPLKRLDLSAARMTIASKVDVNMMSKKTVGCFDVLFEIIQLGTKIESAAIVSKIR